jgi:hypothetical protein
MNKAYVAVNENPVVLCSYGNSPAEAFKNMAKLMKKEDVVWMNGANISILDSDIDKFSVTVYV